MFPKTVKYILKFRDLPQSEIPQQNQDDLDQFNDGMMIKTYQTTTSSLLFLKYQNYVRNLQTNLLLVILEVSKQLSGTQHGIRTRQYVITAPVSFEAPL